MSDSEPDWPVFVEWYRDLHPRLSTAVLALAGEVHLARDITDEAFARAWLHWRRVQKMESPEGWVYRVAVNDLRRRRRRSQLERAFLMRTRTAPSVEADPVFELRDLLADLPARQRTAMALRYVSDLDEAEIARVMGVRRSTVSSALTAGRRRLGARLTDGPSRPTVRRG